jgi:hypothetical protein
MFEIKQLVTDEVKKILVPTVDRWMNILEYLKLNKELEIFNGKCKLISVSSNGTMYDAIYIYNEQNLDFLVVFKRSDIDPRNKDIEIQYYGFEHYYDDEGSDQSLLDKVLKENTLKSYEPIYTIRDTSTSDLSGDLNDVYHFPKLERLYRTFESIMVEISKEQMKDSGMLWYRIQEKINKKFSKIFKDRKKTIIEMYEQLKESGEFEEYGTTCFVERIQVESFDKNKEKDEIDLAFEKFFKTKFKEKTPQERWAETFRDALIFKRDEFQYVIVFHTLEDNELYLTEDLKVHYCMPEDQNYKSMEYLFEEYDNFQNRAIFEIRIDDMKGRNNRHERFGSTSDVFYFKELERLVDEIDTMSIALKEND